jgi:hypothetical protein
MNRLLQYVLYLLYVQYSHIFGIIVQFCFQSGAETLKGSVFWYIST